MAIYVNLGTLEKGGFPLPWGSFDVVSLDVETTGVSNRDRIIEFAAVRYAPKANRGPGYEPQRISTLVDPLIPVPNIVTQITGIRTRDLHGAPVFSDVADKITQMLSGSVVILGHNVQFDIRMIAGEMERAGQPLTLPAPSVCTLNWAKYLSTKGQSSKLRDVCERYGVDPGDSHRAEDDAIAAYECWLVMMREMNERNGGVSPLGFKQPPFGAAQLAF